MQHYSVRSSITGHMFIYIILLQVKIASTLSEIRWLQIAGISRI